MVLTKMLWLSAMLAAANVVVAQQSMWGQCGGINWTGQTACVAGAACSSLNPYYYQCLAAATTTAAGPTSTSTRVTTTSSTQATSSSTTLRSSSSSRPTSTSASTSTRSSSSSRTSTTTSSSSPTASASGLRYIFSFGDSYSQTGFDITLAKPSNANPLGNPDFPGWTTSGGPNWLGYLIATYNTTVVWDFNYAYGGATVNASLVTPYTSTVLSMIDQVTQFSNSAASKPSYAPWTSANALFAVWMGVNDIGNSYWLAADQQVVLHNAILDSYFGQLQIMYNAGGRKFVLLTVPPIQKSPLMLAQSTDAQNSEAVQIAAFNALLTSRAASWQSSHSGSTVAVYDTQVPFNTAIANPAAYGATQGATCYNADGVSCIWWNDYHPAMPVHKLVAQGVAAVLKNIGFY